MRRTSSRPRAAARQCRQSDFMSGPIQGLHTQTARSTRSNNGAVRRHSRSKRLSTFAASAAILVSSVLVSSPAMIAPVGASLVSNNGASSHPAAIYPSANPHFDAQTANSVDSSHLQYAPAPPSSSRQAILQSYNSHARASIDVDVDDHLPEHLHDPVLHWQHARQYDDEAALFGEHDISSTPQSLPLDGDPSSVSAQALKRVTQSAHRYSLPSSYPSSIASSWSRPERSVWFQQKAIIITSIFLAIFIVLFIGAAVFLREKKFDDELEGLDDEEALARIEERMTMGRFSEPVEKDSDGSGGGKFKRHFRIGKKRSEKDGSSSEPSSGSSSAVKRKRHLVSRWTRSNLRDSNDTMRGVSDTASVRSGRSARRAALGDPRASQESVEITYDDNGVEVSRTRRERDPATRDTGSATMVDDHSHSTRAHATDRPRSPPPPHPDSQARRVESSSDGTSSSNAESQHNNVSDAQGNVRSPRRVLLDDSDFQAADAAETHHDDLRHMPPAYIPSGSGGDGSAVAAAIARGDVKHGIPPPEERDSTISPEVISAVLAQAPTASRNQHEPTGPVAAHIATDDKAVLGALSAGASMPSAPAVDREMSAPAYGDREGSAAGASSNIASAPSAASAGPSAPDLEVDGDGFEVAPESAVGTSSTPQTVFADEKGTGKGKGKQVQTSTLLPAPPAAVEPAFSPFDEPYRSAGPPGLTAPSSPPAGRVSPAAEPMSQRKSEKQREAEQEEHMASLVASRPEDVPRYEREVGDAGHAPSAPVLLEEGTEGEDGGVSGVETSNLPAYERRRRSAAAEELVSAPSAPSAPTLSDGE